MPPKSKRGKGKAPAKEVIVVDDDPFEGVNRDPGAADEGSDDICDEGELTLFDGQRKTDRRCRQVNMYGSIINCCGVCAPSRVWRAKSIQPNCVPAGDLNPGFCCKLAVPPEKHARGYQTERAFVKGGNVRNVFLSAAGKAVFPASEWKRYAIDEDGDCFYNAMTKAMNSAVVGGSGGDKMTVHKLRWSSAMHIRPGCEFKTRREAYVEQAPDEFKQEYMMVRRAAELQEMILHPDHWATAIDVRDVYENVEFDVVPIVLNAKFGQKTADGEEIHPLMNPLTVPYGASKERMRREMERHAQGISTLRFVLLLYGGRVGPHFELVVKTSKKAGVGDGEYYDALFKFEEIPKQVTDSFGDQLV